MKKVSLICYNVMNDKRYVLDDGVGTCVHGYFAREHCVDRKTPNFMAVGRTLSLCNGIQRLY